ncbi:Uncharacterized protein TCAP_04725 [Tolypocladium capitatum]|uniref:Uncharacterized protein n=1 Tax=Tolypocladium capitatum TaxID=45235 RepID=A0A2K3QCS6_9HYPO|nr:Uncharacterized protein TCAP_04725 [Tolypocladium capitatum]
MDSRRATRTYMGSGRATRTYMGSRRTTHPYVGRLGLCEQVVWPWCSHLGRPGAAGALFPGGTVTPVQVGVATGCPADCLNCAEPTSALCCRNHTRHEGHDSEKCVMDFSISSSATAALPLASHLDGRLVMLPILRSLEQPLAPRLSLHPASCRCPAQASFVQADKVRALDHSLPPQSFFPLIRDARLPILVPILVLFPSVQVNTPSARTRTTSYQSPPPKTPQTPKQPATMPAYEYCCKCGGMIVISTTCSGCGHKQCSECPASGLTLCQRWLRCFAAKTGLAVPMYGVPRRLVAPF